MYECVDYWGRRIKKSLTVTLNVVGKVPVHRTRTIIYTVFTFTTGKGTEKKGDNDGERERTRAQ